MTSEFTDTEFIILENIYDSSEQEPLRQRDMALIAGTSLGMTNSILKRLAKKGWITAKKLNSRNIRYAVTLDGVNEIVRRSYRYFKRTIRNVAFYKARIDEALAGAKKRQLTAVLLVGQSDLEFIVEHSCRYYGLNFFRAAGPGSAEGNDTPAAKTLTVYSENIPQTGALPLRPAAIPAEASRYAAPVTRNAFYLSRMVMETARDTNTGLVTGYVAGCL